MRPTILSLVAVLSLVGCRATSPASPLPTEAPDPPPGAGMGCGIRGQLIDSFGAPRFLTKVAATTLDRSAQVTTHSDTGGYFALPTECRRMIAVAGRTDSGTALGLVWVEDEAVDVELQIPGYGESIYVRPQRLPDALRLRVLQLVPPAVLRDAGEDERRCDARTNELRRIRASEDDETARHLASVALMETGCGPCPGDETSTALVGALSEDRGLAEAWPFGYGRLFACSPGPHPYEAKFMSVVDSLDPEFAARVVYGRHVEAQAQGDWDGADRMARLLDEGSLADTDFVAGLEVVDLVDR